MRPQHLIMSIFFLQPLAFGAWLPRIPAIQARLDLEPAELAFALMGMPIGLLLAMPFAGSFVSRFGGRFTIRWFFPLFLLAMPLPATATHIIGLFLSLMACGVAMALVELGMNIVADEVEKYDHVAIMSRCHGFWSLGMTAGSLVGSGLAAWGLAPAWSVVLVGVFVLPLALLVPAALPQNAAPPAHEPALSSGLFWPGTLLLGICIIGLASNLAEGVVADWSAVYLTDVFLAPPGAAGLGYTAYAAMMAAVRFAGDWLRVRWEPAGLIRCCYGLAAAGVVVVAMSTSTPVAFVGFALIGIGGALGVPLAISAAASAGGRAPAANVAMVTVVSLIAFLAGPPLTGLLAQGLGLRFALAVILFPPFLLGCFVAVTMHHGPKDR